MATKNQSYRHTMSEATQFRAAKEHGELKFKNYKEVSGSGLRIYMITLRRSQKNRDECMNL